MSRFGYPSPPVQTLLVLAAGCPEGPRWLDLSSASESYLVEWRLRNPLYLVGVPFWDVLYEEISWRWEMKTKVVSNTLLSGLLDCHAASIRLLDAL